MGSIRPIDGTDRVPASGRAPYEWLLFDADGTLFDYDQAEASALEQALGRIGVAYQQDHLQAYRRINRELWLSLERGGITAQSLKVRRFERLLEILGSPQPAAALSEVYLECLAECSELMEGALKAVEALSRHYRLAVLTNGLSTVQRRRLDRSGIGRFISELVISEELGFAKPDPRFFEAAFVRLGRPDPARVLMIGDGWSSDILGAAGFGIPACWFNPGGEPRPAAPPVVREAASLGEIVDWLRPSG